MPLPPSTAEDHQRTLLELHNYNMIQPQPVSPTWEAGLRRAVGGETSQFASAHGGQAGTNAVSAFPARSPADMIGRFTTNAVA
jgi:hypothetical protein